MFRYHAYALTDDLKIDTFNDEYGSPQFSPWAAADEVDWLTPDQQLTLRSQVAVQFAPREFVRIERVQDNDPH